MTAYLDRLIENSQVEGFSKLLSYQVLLFHLLQSSNQFIILAAILVENLYNTSKNCIYYEYGL
jgi:hypothetical protein